MHKHIHVLSHTYVCAYIYVYSHTCTHSHSYNVKLQLLSTPSPPLMYSETLLSLHQTFLLALSQACSSSNPCLGDIFQVILPQLQSYADFITLKRRYARRVCQWQGVCPFQLTIVMAVAYLNVQ